MMDRGQMTVSRLALLSIGVLMVLTLKALEQADAPGEQLYAIAPVLVLAAMVVSVVIVLVGVGIATLLWPTTTADGEGTSHNAPKDEPLR